MPYNACIEQIKEGDFVLLRAEVVRKASKEYPWFLVKAWTDSYLGPRQFFGVSGDVIVEVCGDG